MEEKSGLVVKSGGGRCLALWWCDYDGGFNGLILLHSYVKEVIEHSVLTFSPPFNDWWWISFRTTGKADVSAWWWSDQRGKKSWWSRIIIMFIMAMLRNQQSQKWSDEWMQSIQMCSIWQIIKCKIHKEVTWWVSLDCPLGFTMNDDHETRRSSSCDHVSQRNWCPKC